MSVELVLANSEKAAVVIESAAAYRTGVEFVIDVRTLTRRSRSRSQSSAGVVGSPTDLVSSVLVATSARRRWSRSRSSSGS
jgi:hypothetical protein